MPQALQPIFVDVYEKDLDGTPKWDAAAADTRVNGAIVKVSQGFHRSKADWLASNWQAIHAVDREVGTDWFCGAYHYLMCNHDGGSQADVFLDALEQAGGWKPGDLWPIVDVEEVGNETATRQQFEQVTGDFVARVKSRLGRDTMLYGGSALRALGISSRMGCRWLWTAHYTASLPQSVITQMGWDEASLWGWQYQGTGKDNIGRLDGYPTAIDGFAKDAEVDLSVMVFSGGLTQLATALNGE